MDDEKTYQQWITSRKNIEPEPDSVDRVMQEIRKYEAAASTQQSHTLQIISFQILENRLLRFVLAIVLSALGLFRVAYVPSLILMP